MELRDLEYFAACVEHGHLSRAAAQLHVAQPTLSHAISRLEQDLGVQILHRPSNKRSPMRPTAAGQLLLKRAQAAIGELDALKDDLNELQGLHRGSIRLAGIQSLNLTLLPRVLAAFASEFPNIEFQLNTHPSEQIADRIRGGHEDLGILAAAPDQAFYGLQVHELYHEDFVLIVRRDDPLAQQRSIKLSKIADRDLLLVNPSTHTGAQIIDACEQVGFKPKLRLVLDSGETLRECVRAGLGICILPRGYLANHEQDLQAVSIAEPILKRHVLAIHPDQEQPSRAAQSFLGVLRAHHPRS